MILKRIKNTFFKGAALLSLAACQNMPFGERTPERYVIYYGTQAPDADLSPYSLLVYHPNAKLTPNHLNPEQTSLAYVSIGESVGADLSEGDQALLSVRKNEHWDSHMVDVREPRWRQIVLEERVAPALAKGFDGIMIDTADSPIYLEHTNPTAYKGMRDATISLIVDIRKSYPNSKIMLNRAFDIWPDTAPYIDMLLAESVLSHYNLKAAAGKIAAPDIYQQQMQKIQAIQTQYPHIKVYSVDYWDMNDLQGIAKLYRTQRSQGLIPYVTTPSLDEIHPEPARARSVLLPFAAKLGDYNA